MKRIITFLVLAALAMGTDIIATGHGGSSQRVYTLAEVQQSRLKQPAAWVGRTVLVRGWLVGLGHGAWGVILPPFKYPSCDIPPGSGMSALTSVSAQRLVVVAAKGVSIPTVDPVLVTHDTFLGAALATVACLPVVSRFVPARAVEDGMTLRVRFVPMGRCALAISRTCPDAVLLPPVPSVPSAPSAPLASARGPPMSRISMRRRRPHMHHYAAMPTTVAERTGQRRRGTSRS
jgi:hypothetical protein